MPTLPPETLDCTCYLYPSAAAARAGVDFGGTGFFVAVENANYPGKGTVYVITNHHVACRTGSPVVRVNTHSGEPDIFDFDSSDWEFDPQWDIAAVPIRLDRKRHRFKVIPTNGLITQDSLARNQVGPGDDVFMVGRFVDHDGGPVNKPAVRFGHISVMPTPIEQEGLGFADAFCIDVHSRSGYSGSPVFIYRTPGSDLRDRLDGKNGPEVLFAGTSLLLLLGIHFAQFKELWEVVEKKKPTGTAEGLPPVPLITEGSYVKGLSGMTCVLPAWNILSVLDLPRLKQARERQDEALRAHYGKVGEPPKSEALSPTTADNPQHKEDFTALLGAAVKGKSEGSGT